MLVFVCANGLQNGYNGVLPFKHKSHVAWACRMQMHPFHLTMDVVDGGNFYHLNEQMNHVFLILDYECQF